MVLPPAFVFLTSTSLQCLWLKLWVYPLSASAIVPRVSPSIRRLRIDLVNRPAIIVVPSGYQGQAAGTVANAVPGTEAEKG